MAAVAALVGAVEEVAVTHPTRAVLLAENEQLRAEILVLRSGIEGMDQEEAHRLRLAVIEAEGRRDMAEMHERFARADAERLRAALLAMLGHDPLGGEYRAEQGRR